MNKWAKWIVVLLIGNQIINYFFTKYSIPKQVVSAVERIGCDGYAVSGMQLPFNYLVNTGTDTIVFLTHPLESDVDLKVKLIDPNLPLLKGISMKYKIMSEDLDENFPHCRNK